MVVIFDHEAATCMLVGEQGILQVMGAPVMRPPAAAAAAQPSQPGFSQAPRPGMPPQQMPRPGGPPVGYRPPQGELAPAFSMR